ncbi:hypothetical protein [Neorhizobium alkalisoli]|uniref:hypothetical protein n=1 Tax=Neorhizobium alkalisoli TaxID=528178 RepID=UPI000CF9D41E|nr:hypothetical protein [Neorhizobium alkalisoli]
MKRFGIRKANKGLATRIVAGIGGFLAAAISLGVSIYETRNADDVPRVMAGTMIDAGRWNVTFNSAALASEMPDGTRVPEGKKALVLDLTLENRSAETSNVYGDTLKLENISDAPRPQFYLERDREVLRGLQPLMPETVKVAWQLPTEQELPDSIELSVVGAVFKAQDNLYAAPGWFAAEPVARVELPLDDGNSQ